MERMVCECFCMKNRKKMRETPEDAVTEAVEIKSMNEKNCFMGLTSFLHRL